MRAFIAIDFPYELNNELFKLQDKFSSFKENASTTIVRVENIHITLKFLGETSNSKIQEIIDVLKEIKFKSFDLTLKDLDYFPSKEVPRVIWVSLSPGIKIERLHEVIIEKLKEKNLITKADEFIPHVTLAKVKYIRNREKFQKNLDSIKIKPINVKISSFQLKKSVLTKKGPIYETIKEFDLED